VVITGSRARDDGATRAHPPRATAKKKRLPVDPEGAVFSGNFRID
jgi:hypothetical protein